MAIFAEKLLKMDMEVLVKLLQVELERDFGYSESTVFEVLRATMEELQRAKLGVPPMSREARDAEYPTKPFGLFVPPSVEQLIGRRTLETEVELLSGRYTVLSPSAFLGYPDRGPSLQHVHNRVSMLITANKLKLPSIDNSSDTLPDESASSRSSLALDNMNSRLSVSQTSDDASTLTSGSRLQLSCPLDNSVSKQDVVMEDECMPPSRTSEYDNVEAETQLTHYEKHLEKTLALISKEIRDSKDGSTEQNGGDSIFGINGHWAGSRPPPSPGEQWSQFPQGPPKSPMLSNGRLSSGKQQIVLSKDGKEEKFKSIQSQQEIEIAHSDLERTTNL